MLSNLEVLAFVRARGQGSSYLKDYASLESVAAHFEIDSMSARGHLERLRRNHDIRPLETRDALGVKLPFSSLAFRITRKGIKRLAYMRRGRVPGGLFDDWVT